MTAPYPVPGGAPAVRGAQQTDSTGFEIVERLLREYHERGKCATLEQWAAEVQQRLARFRAEHPAPKSQRDAALVERAMKLAAEVVEDLRKATKTEGPKPSATPRPGRR